MRFKGLPAFVLNNHLKKSSITLILNKKNKIFCKYLYKIGIISSYKCYGKSIIITFALQNHRTMLPNIYILSKPGRKLHITRHKLKKLYLKRKYMLILSTSKGILNNEEAIVHNVGGELLCLIRC